MAYKTNPFRSLMNTKGNKSSVVSAYAKRTTGLGGAGNVSVQGELVTDKSGFSYFSSPNNEYNTKGARKQGYRVKTARTADGTTYAHSINNIRINPNSYLKQEAVARQVRDPMGGVQTAYYAGDTRVDNTPDFDQNAYNMSVRQNNESFADVIRDFEDERASYAKAKNRSMNDSGNPVILAREARKDELEAQKRNDKKRPVGARLSSKGNARGIGLGTGGSGLGI